MDELWGRTGDKVSDALELGSLCGDEEAEGANTEKKAPARLDGNMDEEGTNSVLRRASSVRSHRRENVQVGDDDDDGVDDTDDAIYVDAVLGTEDAVGTLLSPICTIRRAVLVARSQEGVNTIYLHSNAVHYLDETEEGHTQPLPPLH